MTTTNMNFINMNTVTYTDTAIVAAIATPNYIDAIQAEIQENPAQDYNTF